ncbi:MAG: AMP-binding protein [Polyangia bacterium]
MLSFIAEKAREDAPALVRPGGAAMSYATLAMASSAILQALAERVGDVAHRIVGVAVDDGAGFMVSALAVLEAGGVVLPLDLRRGVPALEREAARARALAVIVGDAAEDRLEVVAVDAGRRALPDEACLLVEARGRRAVHGRVGLGLAVDAIVQQVGLDAASRLPLLGPPAHTTTLLTALATLRAGGSLLLVGDDLGALASLGGNVVSGTVELLTPFAGDVLPGIARVVAVNASPEELATLRNAFPSARIGRALDTAEALRVAAAEIDESDWRALPSVELRLTDGLEVRSPMAMLGYLDDPAAADGPRWLRAFDVDAVDTGVLERELAATPGVRESAGLAVGRRPNQRLYAFVAGDAAVVPKHPARVVTLETLPHRADGTIDREALRRMIATD